MMKELPSKYIEIKSLEKICKLIGKDLKLAKDTLIAVYNDNTNLFNSTPLKIKNKVALKLESDQGIILSNYISNIIRTVSKSKQENRNNIISSIIQLLNEDTKKYIYRLDVKKFYESICINTLYNNLLDDQRISPQTKRFIRIYLSEIESKGVEGIGRGVGLSVALSEYFICNFDDKINKIDGVYFYSRFVDDVLIFSHKKITENNTFFQDFLPKPLELHTSSDKSHIVELIDNTENKISYLGYEFICNSKSIISIDISDNKEKKIKNRLAKAVLDYGKTDDYTTFKNRIRYIIGNRKVKLKNGRTIHTGFYYSYKHINIDSSEKIKRLDLFYKSLFYSKNSRLNKILRSKSMTKREINDLNKMSFKDSFKKRQMYNIKNINIIKQCWNND
ncbi:antiviral reverse transcriptase Drt3a [Shewanella algae]|uniref:antiviral reverse transcriptase Drt3a n=1 Tax=Shewanella algae TaxID=38313 RepID=UPI000B9CF474|nr:antiviral reverse transcriptase Drt3a [Shewanella algae]OXS01998.1 hypothetical protein AMR44_04615 [Shewanella algae]